MVPRKLTPCDVSALPVVFQKLEAENPPSIPAFTFVNPPPLPMKLLAAFVKFTELPYVPDKFAAGMPTETRRVRAFRVNRIRRGREWLARIDRVKIRATLRAHSDLQPIVRAIENAGAKVKRDGEQAIAHAGGVGETWTKLTAAAAGVVETETQVIIAVGRITAVSQSALIGK